MTFLDGRSLNDTRCFEMVSGLWKGIRPPFRPSYVLRSTNFSGDGLLNYDDVAEMAVEERHLQQRRLVPGDIIVERSGGGPKQPVGRVALFQQRDGGDYCTSNFTTAIRIKSRDEFDPTFVSLFLHALYLDGATEALQRATTGIRNLDWAEYLQLRVPMLPLTDQLAIGRLLSSIRESYLNDGRTLQVLHKLKRAAMRSLFSDGLRGEAQKESSIGLIPESWDVVPLGSLGRVGNGSTPKKSVREYWDGGTYPWLTSARVYDRQISSAQQFVTETALRECHLPQIGPGAILIAITGQGKTLGHCAVLGMHATISQHIAYVTTDTTRTDPSFLRGYLETLYDYLRQVGSGGGSTKGALTCGFLRALPVPSPSLDEQSEIARMLDAIDRTIGLHTRKRSVTEELFKALLHKLVTGEIVSADLDLSELEPNLVEIPS